MNKPNIIIVICILNFICNTYSTMTKSCALDENNIIPTLAVVTEEEDVYLRCEKCLDVVETAEEHTVVEWMKEISAKSNTWQPVIFNGDDVELSPTNTLVFEEVPLSRSGNYQCVINSKIIGSAYRLDIRTKAKSKAKMRRKGDFEKPIRLKKLKLVIYSHWSQWSPCSRCDFRGHKKRFGECRLKSYAVKSKLKDEDLFKIYPEGIPCHSSILPKYLRNLKKVKFRRNEVDWSYCFEACPTLPAVEYITSEDGLVIEVVETGKGMKSLQQGKPKMKFKRVKRKTKYQVVGKALVLPCPTSEDEDTIDITDRGISQSVRWKKGMQVIDPNTIWEDSDKRIEIDVKDRIEFFTTVYEDAGLYTCWKGDQHIASIKLHIVESYDLSNADIHTYLGLAIVIVVSLAVIGTCYALYKKQNGNTMAFR